MPQTRLAACALVALALSFACSAKDDAPALESGGNGFSGAGSPGGNGGNSSASAGSSSGGSNSGNGGVASSAGNSSAAGSASGGISNAGSANGESGASSGGASVGGASGASIGGAGSGGAGSGGINSAGAASGGKSSGGSSSGGSSAGSGGKSSGGSGSGGSGNGGSGGKGGSGGASGSGGTSACPEVTSQLCGMTAQHNQARANVTPVPATTLPTMSWDATVAAAAQAWADQCKFSHYTAGYGQNLYASAGGAPPTPTAVVSNWVSEVAAFDYAANTCSGTCGHYTQVVWRSSTKVGCGFKSCSTNSPFAQFPNWYIVVCNYSPPGNNGSRPY